MNKKTIIGLVGETGSGKDTVEHYLRRKYNAQPLRFSRPLKKALHFFFDQPSKVDQAWFFDVLRDRFGAHILHEGVRRYIDRNDGLMCVNGLRMIEDDEFIRSFENSYIFYVTADQNLRWERTRHRGEKSDDDQSFEKFQEFEATTDTEKAIPVIGAKADFTFDNTRSLDDLLLAVDAAMEEIGRKE